MSSNSLKTHLNGKHGPFYAALCLLFLVEQLERLGDFIISNKKFSEEQIIFLYKESRYPLLLPIFFLVSEWSNKPEFRSLSDIATDLSSITDGVCLAQGKTLKEFIKMERSILQKSRVKLELFLDNHN